MIKDLLKENRVHGNTMYPVSVYKLQCGSNHILDCHWHDEMEFLMVTEGRAVFQVGTSYFEVFTGQAIFVNSGEIHAGYPLQNSSCSFNAVVFHPDMLCSSDYDIIKDKFVSPVVNKQILPTVHIKGDCVWERNVLKLLSQMIEFNLSKHYTYELLTKANLYLLLAEILSNSGQEQSGSTERENNYQIKRLKDILNYIHAHYYEKISLADLASVANMSEGHFCRFFKQMMKKTPVHYINNVRIRKAANLLEKSTKKIAEIALDVGYDNISYFIATFRQFMEHTPSKYRKIVSKSYAERNSDI